MEQYVLLVQTAVAMSVMRFILQMVKVLAMYGLIRTLIKIATQVLMWDQWTELQHVLIHWSQQLSVLIAAIAQLRESAALNKLAPVLMVELGRDTLAYRLAIREVVQRKGHAPMPLAFQKELTPSYSRARPPLTARTLTPLKTIAVLS